MNPEEADAQAFLFYCFIFGQSLLFLERGPRKRTQLIAKAAEKLVDDRGWARFTRVVMPGLVPGIHVY